MTVQEFLDVDSSYYDKFYLCIDDEYFDDGWNHLDECRDCIISNIEFETYDDMHMSLSIDCYHE